MKTYISYDPDVEKEAIIIKRIPESSFECPKMRTGDMMAFDVVQRSGDHILTLVKVVTVRINISWNSYKDSEGKRKITDAEQFIYVTPEIYESNDASQNYESTNQRKNNFRRSRIPH